MNNISKPQFRASEPDGYTPEGVPVYLAISRGSGKSMLQLEIYRSLLGISDEKWAEIREEVERQMYGEEEANDD